MVGVDVGSEGAAAVSLPPPLQPAKPARTAAINNFVN
jgi:hypothetical protein